MSGEPTLETMLQGARDAIDQTREAVLGHSDPPDLVPSSGLLEAALEAAGLRCALGASIDEVSAELELAAVAAAAIFDPRAASAGLSPDGPAPDTSPRNPWTLVRGLYAGIIAPAIEPTHRLAAHALATTLTDQFIVGAELRRCALTLAAYVRGDGLPVDDDEPGEPSPDEEEASLWDAQTRGVEALARGEDRGWREACAETERIFDAMYANEPATDPNRWLRAPRVRDPPAERSSAARLTVSRDRSPSYGGARARRGLRPPGASATVTGCRSSSPRVRRSCATWARRRRCSP